MEGVSLNLILENIGNVDGLGVVCPECGGKFEFSLDLSSLKCSNAKCKSNCLPKLYEYVLYVTGYNLDKVVVGLAVDELYQVLEDMYVCLGVRTVGDLLKVGVSDIKALQAVSDEIYKVGLNMVAYLASVEEVGIDDYLKARGVRLSPEVALKGKSVVDFKREWLTEEYRVCFLKEYSSLGSYRVYTLVKEIDEVI